MGPMVPARGGPGAHLRSQGAQIIFSSTWSTSSSMHIWCASNEAMVPKDKKQLFREYSVFTRCTAAAPPLLVTCAACAGTLPETGPSSASTSSMSTSTSAPTKSTSKVTAASRFLSCHVGTWLLTWCTLWLKVQGKYGLGISCLLFCVSRQGLAFADRVARAMHAWRIFNRTAGEGAVAAQHFGWAAGQMQGPLSLTLYLV